MKKLIFALLIVVTQLHAADQTFGSWFVGTTKDNDGMYTATVNDSGIIFGKYCFFSGNTCYWTVSDGSTCETSASYPVLMNSDSGATAAMLQCVAIVSGFQ
jgi:hypothetical protein